MYFVRIIHTCRSRGINNRWDIITVNMVYPKKTLAFRAGCCCLLLHFPVPRFHLQSPQVFHLAFSTPAVLSRVFHFPVSILAVSSHVLHSCLFKRPPSHHIFVSGRCISPFSKNVHLSSSPQLHLSSFPQ